MTSKGPKALPKNGRRGRASLVERVQYERKKRTTVDGIGSAAQGGDRECIKQLAAYGAVLLENGAAESDASLAPAADWLANILSDIATGKKSPNEAFCWDVKDTGRFHTLEETYNRGIAVQGAINSIKGKSCDEASSLLAQIWELPIAEVRAVVSTATASARVNGEAAKTIACAIVASKFRMSESTIEQAHKEYRRQG